MIAVDEIGGPWRAAGGRDDRIERVLREHHVQSFAPREPLILGERVAICLIGERSLLLRLQEQLLPEVRHLGRLVRLVECNHVRERFDPRARRPRREVRREVGFELVEQNDQLRVVVLARVRDIGGVDDHGALPPEHVDRRLDERVGFGAVTEELLARHANPRAAQPGGIQARAILAASECAEQRRGVRHGARHRSGRILVVRDRNNAGPVDEAERRFHADERTGAGRTDDRAIGLSPDADRREAGRDGRTGAGARAARIAIQRVRIRALPAARTPAARRLRRADVRPLRKVRLAEDDGAGGAQPRDERRVARRGDARERERAGRRHHAVARRDVVLHQHGDPVERPADAVRLALGIEPVGDGQGIGVGFEHGMELRIELSDTRQVGGANGARGAGAGAHGVLQLRDGRLFQLEIGVYR